MLSPRTLRIAAPSFWALTLTALLPLFPGTRSSAIAQESGHSIIPVGSQWPGARPWQLDISDDGKYVVYQTNRGDGWKLFLHQIGQPTAREVPGLGDIPYFAHISPDGQWLLFGKKFWAWKAPIDGGTPTLLSTNNDWKIWENNEYFLASRLSNGLWRIKADGSRKEEKIASVDSGAGAINYWRPSLLPGGRGVLTSVGFGTGIDQRRIGIVSLPGGKLTLLDVRGINPRYAESGHILYTEGNTLKAIPFDVNTMKTLGPSATVVEGIHVYSNMASQFAISRTGVLVYVPGRSDLNRTWPRRLVWVDRTGREFPFDTPAEKYFMMARLSPDGRYLAAEVYPGVQLFDRRSGTWSVLSERDSSAAIVWSPDSKSLFYSINGVLGRQAVQPMGSWEPLWKAGRQFDAFSLAADGRQLLGTNWTENTDRWRLESVAIGSSPEAITPLLGNAEVSRRNPAISPDGKWLAYVEKTDGIDRVFVQPYPTGGRALLVSDGATSEATEPRWGASPSELFYVDGAHMISVELETVPTLRVKRSTALFETSMSLFRDAYTFAATYDYDRRTDRFLMARWVIPFPPGTDVQVIENAFDLLKRVAPAR